MIEIINKPVHLIKERNHLMNYLYLLDDEYNSIGKSIQIEVIQNNWLLPDWFRSIAGGFKSPLSQVNNIIIRYDDNLLSLIKENFSHIAILEYNLSRNCGLIKPLEFIKLKKFEEEYIGLPLVTDEILIKESTFDIDEKNGLIQINIKSFLRAK